MKDKTFRYIWKELVLNTIESYKFDFDDEEKKKYKFECRNLKDVKRRIHADYNSIKRDLKKNYYNASKNNVENRIDNHKIAACICYSLIRNKLFSFEVRDNMPKRMFMINYELAYTVSLAFIYATLVAQYKNIGRNDLADKLLEQKRLFVPETSFGHDEYHAGRIQTLALNDIYGNSFDILTYSDMMFWIEYYNRQLIEQTLIPMPLNCIDNHRENEEKKWEMK